MVKIMDGMIIEQVNNELESLGLSITLNIKY